MCETVKVVVRCRPMSTRERDMKCKNVVSMDPVCCTCYLSNPNEPNAPNKAFRFDGVYDDGSSTENIYNEIAYPLIEGVPEGYNCTIFAYGQTGCGKSFTMQGPRQPLNQRGIIPRALEQLFEAAAVSAEAKFLLTASFLEIHNEEIRDLLNPQANQKHRLELREHPERGVYVHDLSSHPVHSEEQCVALMEQGWASRAVGSTLMNAESSRSHCIFCVNVERMDMQGEGVRRGKLNLVDLAGSERQAKTGASGERLKEATKINLSLSALGNVISALVDGRRTRHVPYRDSKLTRLLQDSLGGNTKTLMVACLSPADYNYDETLSTLRYAHRAKSIENKPRVNEDPKDAVIRQYQAEIEQLKTMLGDGSSVGGGGHLFQNGDDVPLREIEELRARCEEEQRNKARLQQDLEELKSSYAMQLSQLKVVRPEISSDESGDDVKMTSPELCTNTTVKTTGQRAVLDRLRALQSNMVGGELAHDTALKEKRQRQRKASERRLKALASALGKKDDEEAAVLQVYDDIEHELAAKSDALRRARAKMRAFEREVNDLQREFETERTDYLETIRRQDRTLQLLQQLTVKMAPLIKPECNYSDAERIKGEAIWNEDLQKWRLPEVMIGRTRLPPAGSTTPPKPSSQPRVPSRTAPAKVGPAPSTNSQPSSPDKISPLNQDTLMQKLEKGAQENLAANYFKPKRATELLIKAQEETTGRQWMAQNWKEGRKGGQFLTTSMTSLSSSAGPTLELAAITNNNSSWNHNTWTTGHESAPDLFLARKPARLEALPLLDKIGTRKRPKAELNTLDLM